jgi:hypothetical protein
MAKKVLVPVFPSERFYEAVIRAADIVADEGGLMVFAFTRIRPTPDAYAADGDGRPAELDVAVDSGDVDGPDLERWRDAQISGLEEARRLCYDRGVSDAQIDYLFADEADGEGTAQAIADEAAAGAFDAVVLSRGYFENEVSDPSQDGTPQEVAAAVAELEGPSLVVA